MRAGNDQVAERGQTTPARMALVVSRDLGLLDYYRDIFAGLRIKALAVSRYEAGLASLDSRTFDFILVDQGSRAFEGRRILERAIEINRHIPVVVVTRCLDTHCYLEAMQLGAVDYLEEPISVREMVEVVTTHLRPPPAKGDTQAGQHDAGQRRKVQAAVAPQEAAVLCKSEDRARQ